MLAEITRQLINITDEEQRILDGDVSIQKELYSSTEDFVVDSRKFLEKGRWIDVRVNTRFAYFPPHSHNYIEMVYMLSGHLTTTIDALHTLILKEGDILIMNQDAVHDILPCGRDDLAINFMIMPEFFRRSIVTLDEKNMMRDFLISTIARGTGSGKARASEIDLYSDSLKGGVHAPAVPGVSHPAPSDDGSGDYLLFHAKGAVPVENLIENLLWNLLIHRHGMSTINQTTTELLFMNLSALSSDVRAESTGSWKDIVMTVLEYIDAHYTNGTLEEIASQTGYTTYYLSRILKKHTGQNFKQLLQRRKLQQAAYYLENTTLPVDRIIEKIGYENSSYFYRVYREYYGISPKEYRAARGLSE